MLQHVQQLGGAPLLQAPPGHLQVCLRCQARLCQVLAASLLPNTVLASVASTGWCTQAGQAGCSAHGYLGNGEQECQLSFNGRDGVNAGHELVVVLQDVVGQQLADDLRSCPRQHWPRCGTSAAAGVASHPALRFWRQLHHRGGCVCPALSAAAAPA